jgi:HNH endonuclease
VNVLAEVGRCIYCGSTDPPLTDEHIIPYGLGGDDVLRAASCTTCQRAINNGYESRLLRGSLLPFRTLLGLPTRKVAERPTHFRAELNRGGVWTTEDIPAAAYPATVSWPVFHPPSELDGRPETGLSFRRILNIRLNHPAPGRQSPELERLGAQEIRVSFSIRPFDLAREVAKIGYGYAVAAFGLDAFMPFVTPTIRYLSDDASKWVGCTDDPMPDDALVSPHTVQIGLAANGVVVARIQLFSDPVLRYGVPEYTVLVGRLR